MSELVDDETGEILQVQDVSDPTLNDMIKTACSVAAQISADRSQNQDQAEVKKVYF